MIPVSLTHRYGPSCSNQACFGAMYRFDGDIIGRQASARNASCGFAADPVPSSRSASGYTEDALQ